MHIGHTGVSKLRSRDPNLQGELVNFHVPSSQRRSLSPFFIRAAERTFHSIRKTRETSLNGLVVVREAGLVCS